MTGGRRWTAKEIEILKELKEELPAAEVVIEFNRLAEKDNRAPRNSSSIKSQIYNLKTRPPKNKCIGGDVWSDDEIQYLKSTAEKFTTPDILRLHKLRAKREGWPKRKDSAIAKEMYRLKLAKAPKEDNFTLSQAAKILGIKRYRLQNWVDNHGLETTTKPYFGINKPGKAKGNMRIVTKDALKYFLIPRLHLVADVDVNRLAWFVGFTFAKAAREYIRPSGVRPVVRRSPNGATRTYSTLKEARIETGLSFFKIDRAIERGTLLEGYYWDDVEA